MDAAQVGVGRVRCRDRGEHDLGIEELRLAVELWQVSAVKSAGRCVHRAGEARVFQNRERDVQPRRRRPRPGLKFAIAASAMWGRAKSPGSRPQWPHLHQLGDNGPALWRQAAGADPERCMAGVVVIGEDRALLDLLGGAFGAQSGKLVAQRRRDRIGRRRDERRAPASAEAGVVMPTCGGGAIAGSVATG